MSSIVSPPSSPDFKMAEKQAIVDDMILKRNPRILRETTLGPVYNYYGTYCWRSNISPIFAQSQGPDGGQCYVEVPETGGETFCTHNGGSFGRGIYPEGIDGDAKPCIHCILNLEIQDDYWNSKYFCTDCLPRHMHKCICDAKCCHFDTTHNRFQWDVIACEYHSTATAATAATADISGVGWHLPDECDSDNGPDIELGYMSEPESPQHVKESDNYLKPCYCTVPKYFCSMACLEKLNHDEGRPCLVNGFDMTRAKLENSLRKGPRLCRFKKRSQNSVPAASANVDSSDHSSLAVSSQYSVAAPAAADVDSSGQSSLAVSSQYSDGGSVKVGGGRASAGATATDPAAPAADVDSSGQSSFAGSSVEDEYQLWLTRRDAGQSHGLCMHKFQKLCARVSYIRKVLQDDPWKDPQTFFEGLDARIWVDVMQSKLYFNKDTHEEQMQTQRDRVFAEVAAEQERLLADDAADLGQGRSSKKRRKK